MKSVLEKVLAEDEKKSWKEETVESFEIYVRHSFSRKTWTDKQWFNRTVPCQSNEYPWGITEKQALQIAGKGGTVYKVVATRQRIK